MIKPHAGMCSLVVASSLNVISINSEDSDTLAFIENPIAVVESKYAQIYNDFKYEQKRYLNKEELELNPNWNNFQELKLNAIRLRLINKAYKNNFPITHLKKDDKIYSVFYKSHKNNLYIEITDNESGFSRYNFIDGSIFSVLIYPRSTNNLNKDIIGCYTNRNGQLLMIGQNTSRQICNKYFDDAKYLYESVGIHQKHPDFTHDKVQQYTFNIFNRKDLQRYHWENIQEIMPSNAKINSLTASWDKNDNPVTLFYSYDIPYNDGFLQYSNNFYFKDGSLILGETNYIFKKDNRNFDHDTANEKQYIFNNNSVIYYNLKDQEWILLPTAEDKAKLSEQESKDKETKDKKDQKLLLAQDMPEYTAKLLEIANQLKPKSTKKDCHKHFKLGEICIYSLAQ